jgi:CubicO group peptidase (beta-lactamase class C family)
MTNVRGFRPLLPLLLLALSGPGLLAQGLPRVAPEEVGVSDARLERLTSAFRGYIDRQQLAGAVLLLARDGKVFYHQAFGARDRERNARMETDAIFRIASQSKALVSVAIMMLQ